MGVNITRQFPTHGPERPMVPSAQWSRAKPPAGLHRGKPPVGLHRGKPPAGLHRGKGTYPRRPAPPARPPGRAGAAQGGPMGGVALTKH